MHALETCGPLQDIDVCLIRLIFNASSVIHNVDNNLAESYNSLISNLSEEKEEMLVRKDIIRPGERNIF